MYKPRSGTFRKVKYPLKIYKTSEIPLKDVRNVPEMVEKIKAEETLDCPQYQFDEEDERKGRLLESSTKKRVLHTQSWLKLPLKISDSGTTQPKLPKTLNLPEAQFSFVPREDDLYKQCYNNDDSLPPFPVTSSSGINLSTDSEESARVSEYDMDTEDKEWLEANKESNITPSRLEYVFSKLNKRNTHVSKNAIGGSIPRRLSSLVVVLARKTIAELSPYCWCDEERQQIIIGQHPSSLLKVSQSRFDKEHVKMYLKRMVEMREKLTNVSSWDIETIQSSINRRNEIVNKFATLMKNQGPIRSGKENPKRKLKRVKSAPIPLRVSGRLTNRRKKIVLKENYMNMARMKGNDAPRQSSKRAAVMVQPKKEESKLSKLVYHGMRERKLPTFERVFNGKPKNKKRIRKSGRFVKIHQAKC